MSEHMSCPECKKWGVETQMTEYLSHYHCPRCGHEVITYDGGIHQKKEAAIYK
jgi:predicted RNA-binding Zn-ribbon protein involved in translation (DUF1610 family)